MTFRGGPDERLGEPVLAVWSGFGVVFAATVFSIIVMSSAIAFTRNASTPAQRDDARFLIMFFVITFVLGVGIGALRVRRTVFHAEGVRHSGILTRVSVLYTDVGELRMTHIRDRLKGMDIGTALRVGITRKGESAPAVELTVTARHKRSWLSSPWSAKYTSREPLDLLPEIIAQHHEDAEVVESSRGIRRWRFE